MLLLCSAFEVLGIMSFNGVFCPWMNLYWLSSCRRSRLFLTQFYTKRFLLRSFVLSFDSSNPNPNTLPSPRHQKATPTPQPPQLRFSTDRTLTPKLSLLGDVARNPLPHHMSARVSYTRLSLASSISNLRPPFIKSGICLMSTLIATGTESGT